MRRLADTRARIVGEFSSRHCTTSSNKFFWLPAQHLTILPSALDKYGREGEVVAACALGSHDFQHGKKESFEPLLSYDFSLREDEKPPPKP
jgi:hypothetical protein